MSLYFLCAVLIIIIIPINSLAKTPANEISNPDKPANQTTLRDSRMNLAYNTAQATGYNGDGTSGASKTSWAASSGIKYADGSIKHLFNGGDSTANSFSSDGNAPTSWAENQAVASPDGAYESGNAGSSGGTGSAYERGGATIVNVPIGNGMNFYSNLNLKNKTH